LGFGFRRTRYSGYKELATSFPQQWPEWKLGLSKFSSSTLQGRGKKTQIVYKSWVLAFVQEIRINSIIAQIPLKTGLKPIYESPTLSNVCVQNDQIIRFQCCHSQNGFGLSQGFRHNPKEIPQPHDTAWGVASCTVYTHVHTWLHSSIYINKRAKFITSNINIYNVTNRASSELNLHDADHHHFCAPNQINRLVCSDNTTQSPFTLSFLSQLLGADIFMDLEGLKVTLIVFKFMTSTLNYAT